MARRPLDKRGAEDFFEGHELAADGGQGKTQLTACGWENTRIAANLSIGGLSRKTGRCLAESSDTHRNREALCVGRWMTSRGASDEDLRIRRRGDWRLHGWGTRTGGP